MSRRRQVILMIADTACPLDWKLHLRVTSSQQVAGTLRPGASCVGEGQGEARGVGPEHVPRFMILTLSSVKETRAEAFPPHLS